MVLAVAMVVYETLLRRDARSLPVSSSPLTIIVALRF